MLPASVQGPGMNMGFPDVCLTPAAPAPIPIPYPNMAMHAMAVPTCPTILLAMMPALNMGATVPMTLGDCPGVANPLFMQMGMFTMGSPTVLLQGMPAITMTSTTTGNAMNNPVGMVSVPGIPTILFGCAGAPSEVLADGAVEVLRGDDGEGIVRIRVFSQAVPAAVHTAVAALEREGLTSLVFDVRGNPGGDVLAAIELLRDLLPEGSVVATLADRDGDETTYRARGDLYPWPIRLIVDGGTASAAELFAGSLQAHGRARVAGEKTYGKGALGQLGAGSFLDAGHFLLPGGVDVRAAGVSPDVEGDAGAESTGDGRGPQQAVAHDAEVAQRLLAQL